MLRLEKTTNNDIRYIVIYSFLISMGAPVGIECNSEQLKNGTCSFNAYQALDIKKWQQDTSVDAFAEDIVLSGTFFIGTVMAVWLMYSGWLYIVSKDEWAAAKGKNGIKRSVIGLLLVIFSYTIIRLIQYIARG